MRRTLIAATGVLTLAALLLGAVLTWSDAPPAAAGDSATAGAGADAVTAEQYHACALKNGGVWCWGLNGAGQLGNGTTTDSSVPVAVTGLGSGVSAISAGVFHTCALKDGGVSCWGDNFYGQLGDGTTTNSSVPVTVMGLSSGVAAISAAYHHTCALKDGGVWCWGANTFGELGDGTTTNSNVPVRVMGLSSGVTAISARGRGTCGLKDGGVWCWGGNFFGQLGNGTTTDSSVPVAVIGLGSGVSAISVGLIHACALTDGGAKCWGANGGGSLGDGTTTDSHVPVAVQGLTSGASAISLAWDHTCALKDGGVWCWGSNGVGQLGNGTPWMDSPVPVAVSGLTSGVSAISGGINDTCALKDGAVWCWGYNPYGQLGNGTTTDSPVPVAVVGLPASSISAINAGSAHTCALKDGGVWCWGFNFYGQLGNGSTAFSERVPVAVGALASGVSAISAGASHTCALKDGGVWCWGLNDNGQLGSTSTIGRCLTLPCSSTPVQVSGLTSGVTAIGAGDAHTCALKDGGVWCWGLNAIGQLGNGMATYSEPVPVAVSGLASGVSAISVGWGHTCALKDGGAWCWGRDGYGLLGDGTIAAPQICWTGYLCSATPLAMSGLTSGVAAISAGGGHTCVLKDGGASCWGWNAYGQLGNSSVVAACHIGYPDPCSVVPVAVSGPPSIMAIDADGYHTCALANGSAWCWGSNDHGQLGNNSATEFCAGTNPCSPVAVPVAGLASGVSAITPGMRHTCALKDGGVWCWGDNTFGQLGDNSFADSAIPMAVTWGPVTPVDTPTPAPTTVFPPPITPTPGGPQSPTATYTAFPFDPTPTAFNPFGDPTPSPSPTSSPMPTTTPVMADFDGDGVQDWQDNCPGVWNPAQTNSRREFIDLHVYGKLFDDMTVLNSTTLGDACNSDIDGDGLPNGFESGLSASPGYCPSATANTDPLKLDTDGDGFTDRAECLLGTDPVDPVSHPPASYATGDTDHDGLPDALEVTLGTDPRRPDTDGDRLLDGVEFLRYGSDPLNPNTDGDVCSDGQEAASVNNDTNVNVIDLQIVAKAQGPKGGPKYVLDFDVNRDGNIDVLDLLTVAKLQGAC